MEQNAGNFYVGASGFLKDDAYEVIIQLRKKDANKIISNEDCQDKPATIDQEEIAITPNKPVVSVKTTDLPEEEKCKQSTNIDYSPSSSINHSDNNKENLVQKKSKPGMSAYTQTSGPNSPMQRPVLFHLSSSNSTTYMSPPDMILPQLLKQGYSIPYSRSRNKSRYNIESNTSDDWEQLQNSTASKNVIHPSKKVEFRKRKCSDTDEAVCSNSNNKKSDKKRLPETKIKKCRKKRIRKSKKAINESLIKPEYKNTNTGISTIKLGIENKLRNTSNVKAKSTLNPVIKEYVGKLLALNREGVKAVEIATQYCSSVSTPSSSIINVSNNLGNNINSVNQQITLEQIKKMFIQQSTTKCSHKISSEPILHVNADQVTVEKHNKSLSRKAHIGKKKSRPHKVKTVHIPKNVIKYSDNIKQKLVSKNSVRNILENKEGTDIPNIKNCPPSPKPSKPQFTPKKQNFCHKKGTFDVTNKKLKEQPRVTASTDIINVDHSNQNVRNIKQTGLKKFDTKLHIEKSKSCSDDVLIMKEQKPTNTSTQTNTGDDQRFFQLEENKIQNMEKIADLTEKCTKRLTDLAKVLEEVRRNKSNAYSHISSSDSSSESDQNSKRKIVTDNNEMLNATSLKTNEKNSQKIKNTTDYTAVTPACFDDVKLKDVTNNDDFVPILFNIPKPIGIVNKSQYRLTTPSKRCKPPPALSRVNLKSGQENIIPHELSTVPEIESPMSLKYKSISPGSDTKSSIHDNSIHSKKEEPQISYKSKSNKVESVLNPDLVQNNLTKVQSPISKLSEPSKIQMIDMNKFNELMLKPFVSLDDYLKQCNVGPLDEGSNLEDNPKDDLINDEISSLHSDGSLPDVISELLKRNIISEPFKYDSVSNANSTTISSESSISVLALSKIKKNNENDLSKKSADMSNRVVGSIDTSDTLSISSNPDLEIAFKKLGMGWASSTLKKTKERQALSSSSTSTSSTSQTNHIKKLEESLQGNIPVLITDSLSKDLSQLRVSFNNQRNKSSNKSKHVEQQTSLTKSMTVKEFLTNELAKRITFTSNLEGEDTEKYYTSLYSTKIPNESVNITNISEDGKEKGSQEKISRPSSRQRTSTPVQLFRSTTYNSNSSSNNNSNGLFSNIDDLSSVKATSSSLKNHSNTDKEELSIPNYSLNTKQDGSQQK